MDLKLPDSTAVCPETRSASRLSEARQNRAWSPTPAPKPSRLTATRRTGVALAAAALEAVPRGARGCRLLELAAQLPDVGLARLGAVVEALAQLGLLRRKTDRNGRTRLMRTVALGDVRGRRGHHSSGEGVCA
jgi:hypothetical protein